MTGFRNKTRASAGFTLIEMVVAILIMIVLTSVSVSNMRKGERQKKLAFAADGIVSAVRVAQNYSLSGKALPDAAACANRSPVSYVVTFNQTSRQYTLGVEDHCGVVTPVETYSLPEGTSLRSGAMTVCRPGCTSYTYVSVKFTPPFAKMTAAVTAGGAYTEFNSANFTVQDINGSSTRIVTIDGISGRIGE